jgi:hypothetical protein
MEHFTGKENKKINTNLKTPNKDLQNPFFKNGLL